jgi:hypothetical protein
MRLEINNDNSPIFRYTHRLDLSRETFTFPPDYEAGLLDFERTSTSAAIDKVSKQKSKTNADV